MIDYTFKFLMGLNDSFENIRGQILLMSPIPPLDRTFSMVLQEERQREARVVTQPVSEMCAFVASSSNIKRKFNPNVICEHCSRPGHTKASCYRLIGFPSDFKFTKSKTYDSKSSHKNTTADINNTQSPVPRNPPFAGSVRTPGDQTVIVQGNPIDNEKLGLTPTQLQRLVKYLNNEATPKAGPSSSTQAPMELPGEQEHHSNMADMIGSTFEDDDWMF